MVTNSKFVCQQCGYAQIGWAGRCPECGTWGSLVETLTESGKRASRQSGSRTVVERKEPVSLSAVPVKKTTRITTSIPELDRVLGGGLVSGQVVLLAGEPGIGKSTILLQVAERLSVFGFPLFVGSRSVVGQSVEKTGKQKTEDRNVLYVSGEESVHQIKLRAERLGIASKNIHILEETDVDSIVEVVRMGVGSEVGVGLKKMHSSQPTTKFTSNNSFSLLIVDSIQTMSTGDLSGMAGSVGQVRECTYRLVRFAKSTNTPVIIVGHVTKEGAVAGPSVLMHLVDTVLWFEGDKTLTFRMLRARKNRFGPTDEVGIFSMQEKGLVSVDNPEALFLTDSKEKASGSVVTSILQGTRPVLVEVQALVVPTKMAFPKRVAQGIDAKRFELLLAVLTRRCGLSLNDFDCFANVSGGISLTRDPSADLAICLATASAYFDKPIAKNTLAIGEVGLLGDIRPVMAQEKRVKEAKRLGYKQTITSNSHASLRQLIQKLVK